MRQAIVVRYIGPTNTRGARWKASAQAGSITIAQDFALDADANAIAVAKAFAAKFGWYGNWYGGCPEQRNQAAYVFVCDAAPAFRLRGRKS
jgi:hypothetical protein